MVFPVLILATVAGSLFIIFYFLSTVDVGEMGIGLFFVVTGLLLVGYMVGLMVVGLVGIIVLADRFARLARQHSA
jgi:uncharacterized membrane protein